MKRLFAKRQADKVIGAFVLLLSLAGAAVPKEALASPVAYSAYPAAGCATAIAAGSANDVYVLGCDYGGPGTVNGANGRPVNQNIYRSVSSGAFNPFQPSGTSLWANSIAVSHDIQGWTYLVATNNAGNTFWLAPPNQGPSGPPSSGNFYFFSEFPNDTCATSIGMWNQYDGVSSYAYPAYADNFGPLGNSGQWITQCSDNGAGFLLSYRSAGRGYGGGVSGGNQGWTSFPDARAKKVAIGEDGTVWVINNYGQIFYKTTSSSTFTTTLDGGCATDISLGNSSFNPVIVGCQTFGSPNSNGVYDRVLYHREGGDSAGHGVWVQDAGFAAGISGSRGDSLTAFVYNKDGNIYYAPAH